MINWIGKLFSRAPAASGDSDASLRASSAPDTSNVEDLKSQGNAFLHAGELLLAEQRYRQVVSLAPTDARGYNSLAYVLNGLERDDEAERCANEALRLDPSLADAYYLLGSLKKKHGDIEAAVACFRKAIALAPEFEFSYHDLCGLLIQSGALSEARELALAGLAKFPDSADMQLFIGNLATIQIQSGEQDDAITTLQDASLRAPGMAPVLADVLLQMGRAGEAVNALHRAIASTPDSAELHFHLASIQQRMGMRQDALASYLRTIELKPDFAEAYFLLGNIYAETAQWQEAESCYRQALIYNPQFADAHNNLGSVLCDLGRPEAALACYRQALQIAPEFAEAHSNLAAALADLGEHDAAIASYLRALEIKPDFAGAYNNLGNVYRGSGRANEAMASYRKAFELDPKNALAMHNLSSVLRFENRPLEAEAACRKALEVDPGMVDAIVALGLLQADQGQFAEAEKRFREAIAIEPDSALAWASMTRIRKMTKDDQSWLNRALEIVERGQAPQQEVYLRYAIGKYFDDVGESDAAFANYRRANEVSKVYSPKFDPAGHASAVTQMIQLFDSAWVQERRAEACESDRPILIVGMPRSGTTLAEQILASHPSIFGAGELPFWNNAISLKDLPRLKQSLDESGLAKLAEDYLRYLDDFSRDLPHVVDKMPFNFMFLGIVKAALPRVRIIHMTRDPVDTALSIYFQPFESANAFANDLENIARFYRDYLRVMAHWETVLPAHSILTVPYESLVAEPEAWSRKMIDFAGLPWDDRCLDFHQSERTVATASNWQVRQKISKSSVQRWKKYEQYLGPLLELQQQMP